MSEQLTDGIDEIIDRIPVTEARTISVEEAGRILGISRMAAYQAVWRKEIPHLRIGRRILVPVAKLNEMLGTPIEARGETA